MMSIRASLPRGRRWWLVPAVAGVAIVATGCQTPIDGVDNGHQPTVLVVSDTWVRSHQDDGEATTRIVALRSAIGALRDGTGTGWTGRQDDVTGYLADLSGGSWPGTPQAFLDQEGPALLGVDTTTLRFGDADTVTVPHVITTKATQALGTVPVLDSTLVVTGRGDAASSDSERVTGVRGRVFPGLSVDTTPTVPADQAALTAAAAVGGTVAGDAALVVLPTGTGVLAWEIVVVAGDAGQAGQGGQAGRYYVDAHTGALAEVRPAAADVVAPVPDPKSVQLTGKDPLGRDLTAYGRQAKKRFELTDTTTQAWDPATGHGAVQTYDATVARNDSQLPGTLVSSGSTQVLDAEALAAQSYSNKIVAYYESLGRDSWDDQGGSLVSSVHYGPETFCNAFFTPYLRQPQMVYGQPCVQGGQRLVTTFVVPDVAAHEITHGVTATSAGLLYTGQSGALNESFSDYFGNVIGNLIEGDDSHTIGEDLCPGMPSSGLCLTNPDGTVSARDMLNGASYDDYLRVLNPGQRLQLLTGISQDEGGVHLNSAIWNNALWSIRTRLAQVDGEPGNVSELAHEFDRAVFGALTTRLTPTSGFVDARNAVEQVIVDSQLPAVVLRIAREEFDHDDICAGCGTPALPDGTADGTAVTTTPQTQLHPSVSGDQVVWLDLSSTSDFAGYAATQGVATGGSAPSLSAAGNDLAATFAGAAVLTLDLQGRVTRTDASGSQVVDQVQPQPTLAAGFSGSDGGAAWLHAGAAVDYVDGTGQVFSTDLGGQLNGDTITTIAAGGGTVAIGTDQGKVFAWSPGSGDARLLGHMPGAILDAATYGGPVFVIDDANISALFSTDGTVARVSGRSVPFGATMSGAYVVWAEATQAMESAVVPHGMTPFPDTDLYLLSLATGKIYDLHPAPAQQGFPSLSGNRLVWQDAVNGGDDIYTTVLPEGL